MGVGACSPGFPRAFALVCERADNRSGRFRLGGVSPALDPEHGLNVGIFGDLGRPGQDGRPHFVKKSATVEDARQLEHFKGLLIETHVYLPLRSHS